MGLMWTKQSHNKGFPSFVTLGDAKLQWGGRAVTEKQCLHLEYQADSVAIILKHLFYVLPNADRKSKTEMLHECSRQK